MFARRIYIYTARASILFNDLLYCRRGWERWRHPHGLLRVRLPRFFWPVFCDSWLKLDPPYRAYRGVLAFRVCRRPAEAHVRATMQPVFTLRLPAPALESRRTVFGCDTVRYGGEPTVRDVRPLRKRKLRQAQGDTPESASTVTNHDGCGTASCLRTRARNASVRASGSWSFSSPI